MNREEHVAWAKERALQHLDEKGMPFSAWCGFKHDMYKSEEVRNDKTYQFLFSTGDEICRFAIFPGGEINPLANVMLSVGPLNIRKFIEGFN